ncbi:putative lipo domain protein, partial [Chlamydia psittaci 84-8471/1]
MSYSPISKKHFLSTFFLDSFFKHGIGVGYNMHFSQKEKPENVFNMKSYYAHRLAIDMAEPRDRYR